MRHVYLEDIVVKVSASLNPLSPSVLRPSIPRTISIRSHKWKVKVKTKIHHRKVLKKIWQRIELKMTMLWRYLMIQLLLRLPLQ
ncbi:hypothetical protein ACET3Z_005655 [Daucus carota]